MKLRLIDYFDVWGNARDGYAVNDQCEQAIFEVKDWPTDAEALKMLKKIGYFKKTVRLASVRFHGYSDSIEIEDRKGRPICRLEEIYAPYDADVEPYHLEGNFPHGPRKVYD